MTKEKWLDIINEFEHDFMAIAAYQLTRIADAIANPLIQVDKEGILRPVPAMSAPDASGLVDAVKLFFANEGISTPSLVETSEAFKIKTQSLKKLYSALADFGKEAADG